MLIKYGTLRKKPHLVYLKDHRLFSYYSPGIKLFSLYSKNIGIAITIA